MMFLLLPLLSPIFAALKFLFVLLLQLVFAYVIYRVLMTYGNTVAEWMLNYVTGNINLSDATIQLTGLAAWFAESLRLGQALSVLFSFLLVRFALGIGRG